MFLDPNKPKVLTSGCWDEYDRQTFMRMPIKASLIWCLEQVDNVLYTIRHWIHLTECFFFPKNVIKISTISNLNPFSFSSDIEHIILDMFEQNFVSSGLRYAMMENPEDWADDKSKEVLSLYNWYMDNKEEIVKEWDTTKYQPQVLRIIQLKDYIG